jgi:pimeloyl-ACP methyl ester carboxylesterase
MPVASVGGLNIGYWDAGQGEPVVFIHGSLIADSFEPLLREPSLANRFRLITYRRRGYKDSSPGDGPYTMEQQGSDLIGLLRHLGIERAHLVGHSYGGVVALRVALEAPELSGTLTLLEPALILGDSGPAYRESFVHVQEEYHTGDHAQIIDGMLKPRFGPDYRGYLDRALPHAFDEALGGGLHAAVTIDMPALLNWTFTQELAAAIDVPALVVLGADSNALWARFGETYETLLDWLPEAEGYVLPGATHAQHIQNPHDLAETLAAFLSRHTFQH